MFNTLNEQLPAISFLFHSVHLDFTFSALHMFGYRNKFIHIIQAGYTNIQSRIKINGLNKCSYEVLVIFIDADTRIKRVYTDRRP